MWPGSNQAEPAQRVSERRGGVGDVKLGSTRLRANQVWLLFWVKSKVSKSPTVNQSASQPAELTHVRLQVGRGNRG